MCGRYTLRRPGLLAKTVYQHSFEEFSEIKIEPRFNIAPSQQVAVIRNNRELAPALGPRFGFVRWGLIPSWQKQLPRQQPINARAETVAASGMFRQAFERRRCLQIADGFYEWKDLRDGRGKTPFFIRRPDDQILYLAALWERWTAPGGEVIDTVAHITTTPSEVMAPIHTRMPVMLTAEQSEAWLHPGTAPAQLLDLLKPYPGELAVDEVSQAVNSPKNDGPENVTPV